MRMKLKPYIFLLCLISFVSCEKLIDKDKSSNYYYNWNGSKIIYTDNSTWNYKGTVDCDFETFKVINGKWAKDKYHIIYDGKTRPIIDIKTFYFDENNLPKDSNNVYTTYWSGNFNSMLKWEGADPLTFKLIKIENGVNREMWGKDDKNYYRMLNPLKCHYESFEILSDSYSKDKDNVYYESQIIRKADPITFKFDSIQRVFRDKNFTYYRGERK